ASKGARQPGSGDPWQKKTTASSPASPLGVSVLVIGGLSACPRRPASLHRSSASRRRPRCSDHRVLILDHPPQDEVLQRQRSGGVELAELQAVGLEVLVVAGGPERLEHAGDAV